MVSENKISVVIATYNGEQYVVSQLDSIINQSRKPDEIFISDDKSTDGTLKKIKNWIIDRKVKTKIEIIQNDQNVGYTLNFEKGILASTGNLIFLCDQDDIWYPNKIEKLENYADLYPEKELFIHDTDIADSQANLMGFTKLDQLSRLNVSFDMMAMGTCMVIRRRLIEVSTPFPDKLVGHDNWINEIARFLRVRMLINESFQLYRIHDSNTSSYIGNSTTKLSFLKHLCVRILNRKSPLHSISNRIELLNLIQGLNKKIEKKYGKEKNVQFLNKLDFEKKILNKRLSNLNHNFIKRLRYSSEVMINKNYKEYGTTMTFLNDLIGYKK